MYVYRYVAIEGGIISSSSIVGSLLFPRIYEVHMYLTCTSLELHILVPATT